jgi:hypothetical protein
MGKPALAAFSHRKRTQVYGIDSRGELDMAQTIDTTIVRNKAMKFRLGAEILDSRENFDERLRQIEEFGRVKP